MEMLTITHTSAEGTMIEGTSRGDGSAEVLKANGWRWGRSIGVWYLPRTRDVAPKRLAIIATADQLTDAGFTVTVKIDATPREGAAVEADVVTRSAERAERLTARAERHEAASDAAYAGVRRIGDGIPFGQPILLGHHSQARAERDARRMREGMDKSMTEADAARRDAQKAATAAAATDHRNNPITVANRIQRLTADLARLERSIENVERAGRGDSPAAQTIRERRDHVGAQLEWWQQVRAAQLGDGTARDYGRHNVKAGDAVKIRGRWDRVVRANAKSVTTQSTIVPWESRYPWHEVTDHRAQA